MSTKNTKRNVTQAIIDYIKTTNEARKYNGTQIKINTGSAGSILRNDLVDLPVPIKIWKSIIEQRRQENHRS